MEAAERKDFRKPDEIREFPKGRLELIKIGGATVGRAVFEPGWRWSTSGSRSSIRRAAKRRIFSTTSPGSSGSGWTTAPSSTASRAKCRCCPPATMLGRGVPAAVVDFQE